MLNAERLKYARSVLAQFGTKIPDPIQSQILSQRIELGIPPYEAYLAAGAFGFEVKADPALWPSNSNPFVVIEAQSLRPDNSEIALTFENSTQFPNEGLQRFKVKFFRGRAIAIDRGHE